MSYVIRNGDGALATYYSEKFGRDHGAPCGWVRSPAEATRFATQAEALARLDTMPHEAPECRVIGSDPALPAPPAVDHYATLGLKPGATPKQIKAAFRRLAMKHHPDRGGDAGAFKAIRAAFEALSP